MPSLATPQGKLVVLGGGRMSPAARAARYGLVSAWNGESTADAFGANTLTNNNGVTFTAGKITNAFTFAAASSQFLSVADNASLSVGDNDFWFACWVKVNGSTARIIAGKETDNTNAEWRLDQAGAGPTLRLITWKAGAIDVVLSSATVTTDTYHFAMIYADTVNNLAKLSVDGGAFVQATMTGPTYDSTATFRLGSGNMANFMDGQVDAAAFGKSPPGGIAALATEIRDFLFNGGAGRQYPQGW